jgi:hypothetical protein
MSSEQLIEQLRKQKREIDVMRELFVRKEQTYVDAEMKLRKEAVNQQSELSENLSKRHIEDKEQLENYYAKKVDHFFYGRSF